MVKLTSAIKKITMNATTINGEEYAATFHVNVQNKTTIKIEIKE